MLSKKLSQTDQSYWNKRGEMDSIILIDDETSEQETLDSMKPIWLLRDILINVSIIVEKHLNTTLRFDFLN